MRKVFSRRTRLDCRKFYVASIRKDVNESLSNLYDGEKIRIDSSGKTLKIHSRAAVESSTICPQKFFI